MSSASLPNKSDLLSRIGETPLLKLQTIIPNSISPKVEFHAKAEWFNPGGSVKDRAAYRMIQDALSSGRFRKGQTLLDSTSGNTGIAYALIGAAMGFPVEIVMPTNVSFERKKILQAYGASIIYSDPLLGSDGAREKAKQMAESNKEKYFFPDQYSNPSNWKAHYDTTGPEIWRQTQGRVTHFVAALGTSGTVMGAGRYLREKNPNIRIVALQPEPFHGIEGWKNMKASTPVGIYDPSIHHELITVSTEAAYAWTRELALKEGMLVGPSAGGALHGALQAAKDLKEACVVVMFPDGGDKYLSAGIWDKESLQIPEEFIQQMTKQAEAEYPNECCGMIFSSQLEPNKLTRLRACRNVQNEYHAKDPGNFPRTGRTAFFIDPFELLAIQKDIRKSGEMIRVIYHSHIDAGAYFSDEDLRIAAPEGEPAYPGVDYYVLSVKAGKMQEARLHSWDLSKQGFTGA